jgi:hypothetical protein
MTKDLALLIGPEQPYQTARLFGEDCPEKDRGLNERNYSGKPPTRSAT